VTEIKPTCGTCAHWEVANPYRWGVCNAPLPSWLDGEPSGSIFPENPMAGDCDAYTERDES